MSKMEYQYSMLVDICNCQMQSHLSSFEQSEQCRHVAGECMFVAKCDVVNADHQRWLLAHAAPQTALQD